MTIHIPIWFLLTFGFIVGAIIIVFAVIGFMFLWAFKDW